MSINLQIAASVVVLLVFLGILVWVFRPSSNEQYEQAGKIPLDDQGE
jgi:cbb3-type cytochrome oxidase subunit 3